jgi:hypothetical protein
VTRETGSRLEFTHGGHRYKLDGRPVKSVTTLARVRGRPVSPQASWLAVVLLAAGCWSGAVLLVRWAFVRDDGAPPRPDRCACGRFEVPPGISCAAVWVSGQPGVLVHHHRDRCGAQELSP